MGPLLLGIDIGTSACKAAVFDAAGAVKAQANREYPVRYPQPGWAEQDPDHWWEGVCGAVQELVAGGAFSPDDIAGIGIDGQSWSAIPLDREGKALCPTPIWMDTRAEDICRELEARIGAQAIFQVCGNPLQPAYTLPKILWYKKHLPELYKQADKILQSNSYIAYRLTGAVSQDLSQGYGLQCFDMRSGRWDLELCRELGVRPDLLPDLVPSHHIVGRVTGRAAEQSGLPAGIPVVAGGLDAACGALGAGVARAGEAQEQGGQAGGMSICMDRYRSDPRLILGRHVVPGHWLLQGGTVGGGGALRWLERELGAAERQKALEKGTSSFREMDDLASAVPPGSDGLVFLPYLAGERSPIWDPDAKGVFFGLTYAKTRGHMIRSCLEGVAYSLRHNLETAAEAGATATALRAMGGAANSRLWTAIKADVTGKEIQVPSSDTATTLGAAILAGVAVDVWKDFAEAVAHTVRVTRTHQPDPANERAYGRGYETYLELYARLRPLMKQRRYSDREELA